MQITEVRIKLMDATADRLRAFCSITIDDAFVVRDLKIIDGTNGPFVAMPSRKLTAHCGNCGSKNHLRAQYCNQCGARQNPNRALRDEEGRARLYADIAHPINSECREMIQSKVIATFLEEQELAKQPGYVSRYDDFDGDYDLSEMGEPVPPARASETSPTVLPSTPTPPETRKDPVGKVPPPPSPSKSPPTKGSGSTAPGNAGQGPPAPHKKQDDKQAGQTPGGDKPGSSKAPTPWRNKPKDDFGAGIF